MLYDSASHYYCILLIFALKEICLKIMRIIKFLIIMVNVKEFTFNLLNKIILVMLITKLCNKYIKV